MTPGQMRDLVLVQVDALLLMAPPTPPDWPVLRFTEANESWAEREFSARACDRVESGAASYVDIRAGSSTYRVLNTQGHLTRFRSKVERCPGFEDRGQRYRTPGRPFSLPTRPLAPSDFDYAP